ncbi:MAG: DUF3325 domain-containing protein [Gammaproteobacteria bacterium]|nr:DUF3325 domain-containing protein [Gammaproteobacteria bacterium]
MFTIAAFSAALGGFAALSLGMRRHYRKVFGHGESKAARKAAPARRRRWALRFAGTALLAVAGAACVAVWGWSVGITAFAGVLASGAFANVLLLSYAPRLVIIGSGAAACLVAGCAFLLAAVAG